MECRSDETIVNEIIELNTSLRNYSQKVRGNRNIVLKVVAFKGLELKFASQFLQSDLEVVHTAILNNGLAIKYASGNLRSNLLIVKTAFLRNPESLKYVNNHVEVSVISTLLNSLEQSEQYKIGQVYPYLPEELKANEKIFKKAANSYIYTLKKVFESAPEILKNNKKIIVEILSMNGTALEFLSTELRDDKLIALLGITQNPKAYHFISKRLQGDRDVMLAWIIRTSPFFELYLNYNADPNYCIEEFGLDVSTELLFELGVLFHMYCDDLNEQALLNKIQENLRKFDFMINLDSESFTFNKKISSYLEKEQVRINGFLQTAWGDYKSVFFEI